MQNFGDWNGLDGEKKTFDRSSAFQPTFLRCLLIIMYSADWGFSLKKKILVLPLINISQGKFGCKGTWSHKIMELERILQVHLKRYMHMLFQQGLWHMVSGMEGQLLLSLLLLYSSHCWLCVGVTWGACNNSGSMAPPQNYCQNFGSGFRKSV